MCNQKELGDPASSAKGLLGRPAIQLEPQLRSLLGRDEREAQFRRPPRIDQGLHRVHAPALRRATPRAQENRQLLLTLRLAPYKTSALSMPTLNWIGKEAVVNHHHQVPFHLLKDVPELACGQPGDGNLIVQGDNLVALKALLPYYAGQVKCIYIDPPYNTGNEGWAYNDNVNSPIIRE
jgi:hypothetical protein